MRKKLGPIHFGYWKGAHDRAISGGIRFLEGLFSNVGTSPKSITFPCLLLRTVGKLKRCFVHGSGTTIHLDIKAFGFSLAALIVHEIVLLSEHTST